MANKQLFTTSRGQNVAQANTSNEAGGTAYRFNDEHALAQYAATGTLNCTYYASAAEQLEQTMKLAGRVEPEFVAKCAIYTREQSYMKDMPALLCAMLSVSGPDYLTKVFPRVIDNGKMLRNFVQIMRSGVTGRKSLGSLPKRLVREWLDARSDEQIFKASIGNAPSLGDIIKMVHPRPKTPSREALYAWIIGREADEAALPEIVRAYEGFKANNRSAMPKVPFQMLTSLKLSETHWKEIARDANFTMTRMNLNTFARHGVFESKRMVELIAERLSNPKLVKASRSFPYQLMSAYLAAGENIPHQIREALQDAMEISTRNVPSFGGKVVVAADISGSMHSPLTGHRKGATSKVRCMDVAALMAASVLRRNRGALVLPFHDHVVKGAGLNPRDSIMTNAKKLMELPSGGTNISKPLEYLNRQNIRADLVIYVSDNESWIDSQRSWNGKRSTETMKQWTTFKRSNPKAKLVCIDAQPYISSQTYDREDILNIGGFSDNVFRVIKGFSQAGIQNAHWTQIINAVEL